MLDQWTTLTQTSVYPKPSNCSSIYFYLSSIFKKTVVIFIILLRIFKKPLSKLFQEEIEVFSKERKEIETLKDHGFLKIFQIKFSSMFESQTRNKILAVLDTEPKNNKAYRFYFIKSGKKYFFWLIFFRKKILERTPVLKINRIENKVIW